MRKMIFIAIVVALITAFTVELKETSVITAEIDELADEINESEEILEDGQVNGISNEERSLIERVVAAEARGEGYVGMVAVAQTIKDRGDIWGMSYTDVVLQNGQFAEPYDGTISDLVKTAVHEVFDLGYRATEMPTLYFYAHEKCYPKWASEKCLVAVIGGHTFMY